MTGTQRLTGFMVLIAALAAATGAQAQRKPAPVCPAGTQLCTGQFGRQCYTPSAGQHCSSGAVCPTGQQLCAGSYGTACYQPSAGQHCMSGLVCSAGQQLCLSGGYPQCYSPMSGEHCP